MGRHKDPTEVILPELGDTEASIREYLAAVALAVATTMLDVRVGNTLINAAKLSLAALKQQNAKEEIEKLKRMLAEARSVSQAGRQREADDRQRKEH